MATTHIWIFGMSITIATTTVSGDLVSKFDKIADAGFRNIELYEPDFIGFSGSAADVAVLAKNRGLNIQMLQPFADLEGFSGVAKTRAFDRLEQKFNLMQALNSKLLLVCSNCSQHASGRNEDIMSDLHKLASRAEERDVRIAYLALPWAAHIKTELHAYELIKQIDHPNLGLCLNSRLTLGDGSRPARVKDIDGKYIFHVQLSDMLRTNDNLPLLNNQFGVLPGQGNLNISGLVRLLTNNRYKGSWSSSDVGSRRSFDNGSSAATDAFRALVNVLDEVRSNTPNADFEIPELTERVYASGFEFIEFAVDEESRNTLTNLLTSLRFRKERRHLTKSVELWRQGSINIVVNSDKAGYARAAFDKHGATVCDMGLRVQDAEKTVKRAMALGSPEFSQPLGTGELNIPAIEGVGGNVVHFIDEKSDLHHVWDIEFKPTKIDEVKQPAGLRRIDHVAQTMRYDEMQSWLLYYTSTFEMQKTSIVDVVDPSGVVASQAIRSPEGEVRLNLNGVEGSNTIGGNFLADSVGAGVQHIAFLTDDIFETSNLLAEAKFQRLEISPNYYSNLHNEFGLSVELVQQLKSGNILYSQHDDGEYFQIYSQSIFNGLFFEVVERRNRYDGYGAENAPIRLAAQSQIKLNQKAEVL
jgi:4-hydroxyphenylpyruvate dioxygenase